MGILLENAVADWHRAVNEENLAAAKNAVTNPVVVLGPKGAGAITQQEFAKWIARSGIRLKPRSWHPNSGNLVVVEQDASWPDNPGPVRVATPFREAQGKVSAALRFPKLEQALEFASMYRELTATEDR